MIYEIKTYQLMPGSQPEVEKRLGAALAASLPGQESLLASWHSEIGLLNEVVQVYAHHDLASRKDTAVPEIDEFVMHRTTDIVVPFPGSPAPQPGQHGPFYELRYYDYKPPLLQNIIDSWTKALPGRLELSPLWLLGHIDLGEANRFVHIWPYHSLNERDAIRRKSLETGAWPPPGGPQRYFAQANKILVPAAFSPAQ